MAEGIGTTAFKVVSELAMKGVEEFYLDAKKASRGLDAIRESAEKTEVALKRTAAIRPTAIHQGGLMGVTTKGDAFGAAAVAALHGQTGGKPNLLTEEEAAAVAAKHRSNLGRVGLLGAAGGIFAGAGLGLAAASQFRSALEFAKETAATTAQINQAIKSTGDVSGVSAEHVEKYGNKLAALGGIESGQVQQGELMLLNFTKVRNGIGANNQIFDKATLAAANWAARTAGTGQEMSVASAAQYLGKALQDPIKGVALLRRAHVILSQAQSDSIKVFVAQGNTVGAQKVILDAMNRTMGGAAAAAGKTLPGSLVRLSNAWKDARQELFVKSAPAMTHFANWLAVTVPKAASIAGHAFDELSGKGAKDPKTGKEMHPFFHWLVSQGSGEDALKKLSHWGVKNPPPKLLGGALSGPAATLFGIGSDAVGHVGFSGGRAAVAQAAAMKGMVPFKEPVTKVKWDSDGADPLSSRPVYLVLADGGKPLAQAVARGTKKAAHATGRGSQARP